MPSPEKFQNNFIPKWFTNFKWNIFLPLIAKCKLMNRLVIYSLFVILFASCKVIQPNKMFEVPDDYQYAEFKQSQKEYIIQSFDKLELLVFTNDGMRLVNIESNNIYQQTQSSIEYLVEHDGMVKAPVLGRIKVDGLTVKQAEELLEEKYAEFYQKPFVKISVINRRVIVFSAGSENGTVILLTDENYTLIEALAMSGGISDMSKAYSVKLIRGDLNDPEIFLFNLSSIDDLRKSNLLLEANDIIYVETKPRYASRILNEISPYLSLLTTIILITQLFK